MTFLTSYLLDSFESAWLLFILLELTSVSFSGYWPEIKTEKGRKVSKKLADLA